MIAPRRSSSRIACSTHVPTWPSRPSSKYSLGSPMRRPESGSASIAGYSSTGLSMLVESRASKPAIAASSQAASSALRAMAPP